MSFLSKIFSKEKTTKQVADSESNMSDLENYFQQFRNNIVGVDHYFES
ncbi:MAG: hypothetical protein IZT56_05990, partial [Bacteroidetes bacterium]|nr:hypothetical protein [Bacteroidota bacterium]